MKISETIIVEGKDDISAVLAAVDANVICTHGYGINDKIIASIEASYKENGIIIFTDPDHAGRKIRERLTALFPNAKQAYLTQDQAYKEGDIGIENAAPKDIILALNAACAEEKTVSDSVTEDKLFELGLAGLDSSSKLRSAVGAKLGIGYANVKTFLKRLNYTNISLEVLVKAVEDTKNV